MPCISEFQQRLESYALRHLLQSVLIASERPAVDKDVKSRVVALDYDV